MKRNLLSLKSQFWRHASHHSKRSARSISPLLFTTALFASQNLWFFTLPAKADKVDGSGNAICAVPGQDGSPTSLSGQVNTYFQGTSTSVSAGATSIVVGPGNGATNPIQAGDLLLIIQMQGADIDSTNTNAYGDSSSGNNAFQGTSGYPAGGVVNGNLTTNFTAGNFEYAVATNSTPIGGGTINLSSPLVNSYANTDNTSGSSQGQKRFQVIRVPQYSNLTISGTVSAASWNGSTGGIVAIDVAGKLTFGASGKIDVSGQGFRGGAGRRLSGDSGTPTLLNTDVVTLSSRTANASKGEGTAGTPKYLFNSASSSLITGTSEGYPNGSYGRGAPGNAGGGGTDGYPKTTGSGTNEYGNGQNSGGGGGSNGGYGGKGGYTWYSTLPYGGDGGAVFPSSARRLVLGGGGGAGTTNDGTGGGSSAGIASSGAAGGGIVMLRTGSITGAGVINTNGATPTTTPANDASGGGGAGGSVLVISQSGSTAGLTISANGGKGGTNTGGGSPHGPGGGGGGGVIYTTLGATSIYSGGQSGTTNNNVTEFGGATAGDGSVGPVTTTAADATTSISGASCLIQVNKTTSTPTASAPGTATYTITASNPSGAKRAGASGVVISDDGLPTGFTHTATAIVPVYSGGAAGPANLTSTGTTSKPSWSGFTIPSGGSVALTFTVNIATGAATGKYNNSATASAKYINTSANVTAPSTTATAVDSSYDGTLSANTGEDVTISAASALTADKSVVLVVDSDKSGGTTPLTSQTATPGDILEYTIAVTNTSTTTNSTNVILTDAIPTNTTYVPGTLQVATGANSGAKTDASGDDQAEISGSQLTFRLGTGATATAGGTLGTTAANKSATIKFRVQINDPLPNAVATVSNQAIVSSTGVANVNSNDPSTPTAADPTVTKIGPRLRLVKRITGVTKATMGSTKQTVGGYYDLATDPNDNASGWAGGSAAYLLGAITGSQIPAPNPGVPAPKDEVEYTIYFLSDGAGTAQNASICDFVPVNQSYVSGSLQLNFNGTTTAIADGSGTGPSSGFYTASFPTACQGTNNNKGAAYFQVGNVTSVNATPASSYGFVRFRAKVD